ncbi:hypothetical protein AJ79_05925 [Helicocarpus griseus UAMH5409]|uniref:DUF676 domain-containing protein n=1 Tax=Helicocarpus griseus UAMH5409 TaxID=1447875 RepID=A0A2B7XAR3_9EURO|nr:hypothetical protein AJ79_05925 [Helicocarpus griseus UAMH5409]
MKGFTAVLEEMANTNSDAFNGYEENTQPDPILPLTAKIYPRSSETIAHHSPPVPESIGPLGKHGGSSSPLRDLFFERNGPSRNSTIAQSGKHEINRPANSSTEVQKNLATKTKHWVTELLRPKDLAHEKSQVANGNHVEAEKEVHGEVQLPDLDGLGDEAWVWHMHPDKGSVPMDSIGRRGRHDTDVESDARSPVRTARSRSGSSRRRGQSRSVDPNRKTEGRRTEPSVNIIASNDGTSSQLLPEPTSDGKNAINREQGFRPDSYTASRRRPRVANEGVRWLQDEDMLPAAIPNARILALTYPKFSPSAVLRWGKYCDEVASKLLIDLEKFRGFQYGPTPVIYIGHGFGGIMLQKALVLLSRMEDPAMLRFRDSTAGFLFLNTPFPFSNEAISKNRRLFPGQNRRQQSIINTLDGPQGGKFEYGKLWQAFDRERRQQKIQF